MPIRLLADDVVSQIAAGEVIERPASVVKELVENALDAGARTITLSIEGGGRALIRIADDGQGIPASEVELAFARHATSKINATADLFALNTLGFRGEALAAIASVSRVNALTRAHHETTGTQLRLEGGRVLERTPQGVPQGTVISVSDLFFNVPARLKFLKSESSERSHITGLVARYALAYPQVRFKLLHDGRTVFQTHGAGEVREVLVAAYGVEIAKNLIEIDSAADPVAAPPPSADDDLDPLGNVVREPAPGYARPTVRVHGFISPPSLNRANRKDITLFANGRWIQDARLTAAVTQAYHTMLMVGRYPLAVVFIEVPPADVDVNVHPTKAEVRFRYVEAVFGGIERTVRRALTLNAPVPHLAPRQWDSYAPDPRPSDTPRLWSPDWFAPPASASAAEADMPASAAESTPTQPNQPLLPLAAAMPLLRVIGQIGTAYIVAEGPDGLYLIDQHAAHERVLYEQFSVQHAAAQVVSQHLLNPMAVQVPAESAATLEANLDLLNTLGFGVEAFGANTFLVRALPTVLGQVDPARAVRVVIEDFEEDETPLAEAVEQKLIARICKRAAIKAGQTLTPAEMTQLVMQLERCQSPRTCPHGRPTMIHLSVEVLERQFGRKG